VKNHRSENYRPENYRRENNVNQEPVVIGSS
jgi:hypothetical protein